MNMENLKKLEKRELKHLNERDFEFFREILLAETIGGEEYLIQDTLLKELKRLGFKVEIDSVGNIAAIRGVAVKYPLLNAHMDIVGFGRWNYIKNNLPLADNYRVIVDMEADTIYGTGKDRVLGGDDKCGIMIALKVAELLIDEPMKLLFTVEEEGGCIGIKHFTAHSRNFFDDIKYSLTIDRREGNHLLSSQIGKRSCSMEFEERLLECGYNAGIEPVVMSGTIADVIYIREIVKNSVNMSAGYHRPHTNSEYIVISEVDSIIGWVKEILLNN